MAVETASCLRELEIEIPVEQVEKETERIVRQFARVARIPGFRPGKAPAQLVRRRFWEDIRGEVLHSLLPSSLEHALREKNLSPVGDPSISNLQFEPEKPVRFKASFEVLPEITLNEYKGLRAEPVKIELTEKDVEQELERLRERAATFEPVENRASASGDTVVASLVGVVTSPEEKRDPIVLDEVEIHLDAEGTIQAFSQGLRGSRPEEERKFEVTYPEDFPQADLAGRTVAFTARVKSVRRKQLPGLDDDFAQQVGDYKSLEELKEKLQKGMDDVRARREMELTKERLLDALISRHDFPVPETLVEGQMERRLERRIRALATQGIDPRRVQVDWAKLRREQREPAAREVKLGLLLERIAEVEGLEPTDEEVNREIERLSHGMGQSAEALRARLTKEGGLSRINSAVRSEKAVDFIYSHAKLDNSSREKA